MVHVPNICWETGVEPSRRQDDRGPSGRIGVRQRCLIGLLLAVSFLVHGHVCGPGFTKVVCGRANDMNWPPAPALPRPL
jgi:hypothetical protein